MHMTPLRLAKYIVAVLVALAPLLSLGYDIYKGVPVNWGVYVASTVTFWVVFHIVDAGTKAYNEYKVRR